VRGHLRMKAPSTLDRILKDDKVEKCKSLYINIEPYVESYILSNYFRIYKLLPYQMKGI
jgi:hypothetical protein